MYIKTLRIRNFKSIVDLSIELDKKLSILTGVNNSGKTTILEAIALWAECFDKLLHKAQRSSTGKFQKGDYVFGPAQNRYFNFEEINSVRSPDFEDVFHDRNIKSPVILTAVLENEEIDASMTIGFIVKSSSSSRYSITLQDEKNFDYSLFNRMFDYLPQGALSVYFSSPVAFIEQRENHATDPQVRDLILRNRSFQVIRNRIYKLYDTVNFADFEKDVSYVLFGSTQIAKLKFVSRSRVQENVRVLINYTLNNESVEKDLALLGSGSLQVIEILLDMYHQAESKRDMFLVMLDEPDSHIHRSIQARLLQMLSHEKFNNQVIITTHNESLIRTASLSNLFHIDGSGTGKVSCLYKDELPKLNKFHFSGIYPSFETPVLRSLSSTSAGIDFISAIEADKIVFVEGDDDARLLYRLFTTNPFNKNTKLMFWVLGGVSKVMDKVEWYKFFFSEIRNKQSLWDKSVLVFDRDDLTDEHLRILQNALFDKYGLRNFSHAGFYTQESVFLSNVETLATLLSGYLKNKKNDLMPSTKPYPLVIDTPQLQMDLRQAISDRAGFIMQRYNQIDDSFVTGYEGRYIDKIKRMVDQKSGQSLTKGSVARANELKAFYQFQKPETMATKEDVIVIIRQALAAQNINIEINETIFYELLLQMHESIMYPDWMNLRKFLES